MKTSKAARAALIDKALNNPEVTQEECIQMLKEHAEIPETRLLIDRELARTVNRIFSTIFDDDGIRMIFGIRGNSREAAKHVNIMLSNDANYLKTIVNRLDRQKAGIQKSLTKAKGRLSVLEGQISLDELTT